ncbi:MAG: hypothetical protein HC815_27590 [Richelia sp. RM1_1_1]|nr:hypothetical protein [Richelia sp. RM1_1_1]
MTTNKKENMNIDELMNCDYPIPDPAWDYSEIYHQLQKSEIKLEQLIKYMSDIENATTESDSIIKEQINDIGLTLNSTQRIIDHTSD